MHFIFKYIIAISLAINSYEKPVSLPIQNEPVLAIPNTNFTNYEDGIIYVTSDLIWAIEETENQFILHYMTPSVSSWRTLKSNNVEVIFRHLKYVLQYEL